MAEKAKEVDTAPDPDEDDLDDLDDVLDKFDDRSNVAQSKPTTTSTAPIASGPGRPADTAVGDAPPEDDLAKQLQATMSSLVNELGENPDMQKQFEDMMQELISASAAPTEKEAIEHVLNASDSAPKDPADEQKAGGTSGKKEDSFQDTIRKTMERMQQSGDAATAAASTSAPAEDELLAQMMKELGAGGDMGSDEDFNKMLMSMMTQLTNKDILYEPMKELHDKFPAWLEQNGGKTEKKDLERYREQQVLVREIVGRFERDGYSDENENDREYIVERMQKMQAAGSPPPDLVGDMNAAQEALGDLESGCPTQ